MFSINVAIFLRCMFGIIPFFFFVVVFVFPLLAFLLGYQTLKIPRGARNAHRPYQMFSILRSFSDKMAKIKGWYPTLGVGNLCLGNPKSATGDHYVFDLHNI